MRSLALLLLLSASCLGAQTIKCDLAVGLYGMAGNCITASPEGERPRNNRTLLANVWPADSVRIYIARRFREGPPWLGTFTLPGRQVTFEIAEQRREGQSPRLVLRTTWSWVTVHDFREVRPTTGATLGAGILVFGLTEYASASEDDIAILEDSRRRLDSLGTWDRADDRNCANDASGSTSLFCLLVSSVERRMGQYHHRQPALDVLRAIVTARWRDRMGNHPLMDFNNHPRTTMADLRTALQLAIDTVRAEAGR